MTNEKQRFRYALNLQLFAEDPPQDPPKPEKVVFTPEQQAEVDRVVADRIARAKKPYADYDELKTKLTTFEQAEEERKKAAMTEQERLAAERDEALKKAQESEGKVAETLTKANHRLVKAEFRLLAKESGVMTDALDDALVLADLSSVTVDDNGNVTGVKEAVETLKQSKSYLFGSKGGKPIGDSTNPPAPPPADLTNLNPRQMMAMGYSKK